MGVSGDFFEKCGQVKKHVASKCDTRLCIKAEINIKINGNHDADANRATVKDYII